MKSTSSKPATGKSRQNGFPRRFERSSPDTAAARAAWRMPSGLGLAEFALKGGFVAPGLMKRTGAGERP